MRGRCRPKPDTETGEMPSGRHDGTGKPFADGTYRLSVEIGPISARKMETFFPGAIDNRILTALMELFLPADKELQVRYIIQQEDAQFRLGDPAERGAYLGISTYL